MGSCSGCHGGLGRTGIAGGTNVKNQIPQKSNDTSLSTADQIAERFHDLFNSFVSGDRWNKAQIALRFQNHRTASGRTESGGEMFTGTAFWRLPDQSPTCEVPGPLPVLGRAAAKGGGSGAPWPHLTPTLIDQFMSASTMELRNVSGS
jgi:hypothetical protein